ncbi:MAG: hypothetical protein FJ100_01585 [Deltaproteobacteria bacterium]|nr:hypothetical protein [Deltaproteobacteria bacterium]
MVRAPACTWFAAAVLAVAACPARGHADWRSINQVALGTAQTLEQNTFSIGVVAPLLAGLTNRLTVQTHPILDLLLVPNLSLRYRLVDNPRFAASVTGSFKRSFGQGATTELIDLAPGELVVGGIVSAWLGSQWSLTGGAYWANHFDEPMAADQINGFAQGVAASLGVHFLPAPTDLLQMSTYVRYGFSGGGFDDPVLAATWTHATRRWLGGAHTVIHLTVNDRVKSAPGRLDVLKNLPVVPTFDLWWRL